ncbi:medium-chain fatty acid-CoA ligase faa2, partial [Coemansia sp. RSA 2599]
KEFLGTREYFPETNKFGKYTWVTTTETMEIVNDLGAGLDSLYAKHAPELNDATGQQALGVFSIGRAEWFLAEFAGFRSRRYTVGITDAAGVEVSEYVMNFADTRIVVSAMDKIPRMLDRIKNTPNVKVIISMDKLDCSKPSLATQAFSAEVTQKLVAQAESLGVVLMDLDQVIQLGKANPTEPTLPTRDDLCTIGFTSGTTGVIKGVMLQHKACISSARGVALMTDFQESTYLSYLTYAHMYDRDIIYFLMHRMVRIGFFSGEKTLLLEDMQTLQPTFVAAIPPVLNRIYDKLALNTIGAKGLKGMLCRMAHRSKVKRITSGRGYRHPLWDRIVFDKVAKLLGGRVQLLASGGCMLGPE